MKKINYLFILFMISVLAIGLSSCSKKDKASISINENSIELYVGDTFTVDLHIENAKDKSFDAKSNDNSIATVKNNVITAVSEGNTTITFTLSTYKDKSATLNVKVIRKLDPSLELKVPNTLYVGDESNLNAVVVDATGTLTYKTSDESIATVNNGVLQALSKGEVTITATVGDLSASVKVTILEKASIKIEYTTLEVVVGKYINLQALLVGIDTATWSSSNEEVATVVDGKVTGRKAGKTVITLSNGDIADQVEVIVKDAPTLTIQAETNNVLVGSTLQLNAVLTNTTGTVTYSSGNNKIATVSKDGVVTGIAEGKVVITAVCGSLRATFQVVVTLPTFEVTFNDSLGNLIEKVTVSYGKDAVAPNVPTIEGMRFVGWDKAIQNVKEDMTVQAIYKKVYSITYVLDGGALVDAQNVLSEGLEGETIKLPVVMKPGYSFLGWSIEEGSTNYITEVTLTKNVQLYANYQEKVTLDEITVGAHTKYPTIQSALDVITAGGTIYLSAGTYDESLTIEKGVTIVGPNKDTMFNTNRVDEAVITGKVTINASNVTINGIKFTNEYAIVAPNAVNKVEIISNHFVSTPTVSGTSSSFHATIDFKGNASNTVIRNNYFDLQANLNYLICVFISGKATNVEVNDNYFTNACITSQNSFAVRLEWLNGYISVSNNTFDRFAGDYWTVFLGNSSCENNTIIDVNENIVMDSKNTKEYACGFSVQSVTNDTIYVNYIGNQFENCKDTVLCVRGSSTTDKDSKPHVTIMYNKFLSVSARMRFCFNPANFVFSNNYTKMDYTNQSNPPIDVNTIKTNEYTSEAMLDTDYLNYKNTESNPYVSITYVTEEVTINAASKVVKGSTITLPTPKRENYAFLGWTKELGATNYLTTIEANEDMTLYANWEKIISFMVTYHYNGGYSEELFVAHPNNAPTLGVNNYNYVNGAFWSNLQYSKDVFISDPAHDPMPTFSDRIYIGINNETGLYEVVGIIRSGASNWVEGASYVIVISNSINNYYAKYQPIVNNIKVGQIVAFSKPIEDSAADNVNDVYFFDEVVKETELTMKVTSADKLIVPGNLGYRFLGWYDLEGNKYEAVGDLNEDTNLYARWEELKPVTDIHVESICDDMRTGEHYQIIANVLPLDAYFKQLIYTSSDENILKVTDSGELIAVNAGKATIKIVDYMHKAVYEKEIIIYHQDTLDVSFSDGYTGVLRPNETVELLVKAYGKDVSNVTLKFESKNPEIAIIDDKGVVTAIKDGIANIKITASGIDADITFSICVKTLVNDTEIDRLLSLLVQNSFTTVEVGNVSLYNDGSRKVFVPVYGSVNRYLFDEFKVDNTYYATSENNPNNHQNRRPTDQIEFVTVHDTATLTGTVVSIASGMSSGETSIHYTVGNNAIYGVVPEKYIAYHAGDGTGTPFTWTKTNAVATANVAPSYDIVSVGGVEYLTVNGVQTTIVCPKINGNAPTKKDLTHLGPVWKVENGYYYIGGPLWSSYNQVGSKGGNNNSIGIEMCSNLSGDIYDTWQRTAQLVSDILIRNKLDTTRVKMHNTWSGKNCPQDIIEGDYWNDFMKMVELQYEINTKYSGAKITMESSRPDIVDNTGRVIKPLEVTTTVNYTITVEYKGEKRSINLSSIIPGTTTWEQWEGTYSASVVWNNGKFQVGR